MGGEFLGDDNVIRQMDRASGRLGPIENRIDGVAQLLLAQRLADIDAAGIQERVGHAATDDQMVYLGDQIVEHVQLGGNLGAADHRSDRLYRLAQRGLFLGSSFLHFAAHRDAPHSAR